MLVKDHIIKDVKNIEDPDILHQVYEYLQVIKHGINRLNPNHDKVFSFAGMLSDKEAKKILKSTDQAFHHIEGEW